MTISTINDPLVSFGEFVLPDIENNEEQPDGKDGKCQFCMKNLRGIKKDIDKKET